MGRYKLKYGNKRPKAFLGLGENGAILAAAGINVAGTLAAAGMSAKATKDAAKQQAAATIDAATKQAASIKEQSERAKILQQESQDFTKEQNAENRELQKDIQMNLQMLTGKQTVNDRLEAAKIQVKNGGSMRRKLAEQNPNTLLRGGYNGNMPFTVTDGGGVIPLGSTPEGFDLYELYGNDHEHYHKTQGGKNKTGVGVKFANGKVIEGEGNQSSNQGEYLLVTPNDALFLSKHTMKGFNPALAVNQGMNPLEAFMIQEQIKAKNNISDNGKKTSKNKRNLGGGTSTYGDILYTAQQVPDLSMDYLAPVSTGVAYGKLNGMYENNNRDNKAKCGTRVRKKLANGGNTNNYNWGYYTAPTVTTLGNIGGAWITNDANNRALGYITAANNRAAGIIADAYSQMHGIDLSSIRKEDYSAGHALAQLRAPIINTSAQRAEQERTLQRRLENARRYSISGASAQDRMTLAETNYNDNINKIESEADRFREQIKQQNIASINETARLNAQLDTQANREYANAYLNALQYNNDIENQKFGSVAQASANAIIGNAQANAATTQANAQAWGNAFANSAQSIGNSMQSYIKEQTDRRNALIGVSDEQAYRAAMHSGSRSEKQGLYDAWVNGTPEQQKMASTLDNSEGGRLSSNWNKRNSTTQRLNLPIVQGMSIIKPFVITDNTNTQIR